MSRIAAIDAALRLQLEADNKRPQNYTTKLRDAPYAFDASSIQLFLLNVANRLRLDTPPIKFDWKSIDPSRTIDGSLMVLIGQIDSVVSLQNETTS